MIQYEAGHWGLTFIFGLRGSVFPKAVVISLPNAILAAVLHHYLHPDLEDMEDHQMVGVDILWSGYTFVLGFLVVFRNNQAYSRFWEGSTLINQVRGEWFNAISSLFAFCSRKKDMRTRVHHFQHLLVRLSSMMYCAALQQVCDFDDHNLEIIDVEGFSAESLDFLQDANDRCEILLQWIQRLIVEMSSQNVIDIPPPVLSRAFQELSRGIVNLNNVRKIRDIPFPYPYAQMITTMLLVHWIVTPFFAAFVIQTAWWSAIVCFFVTASFWSLKFIVLELDQPFGMDPNDLPVGFMQQDFNKSLLDLLDPVAQHPPEFRYDPNRAPDVIDSKGALTRSERPVMETAHSMKSLKSLKRSATQSPNRLGGNRLRRQPTHKQISPETVVEVIEDHRYAPTSGTPEASSLESPKLATLSVRAHSALTLQSENPSSRSPSPCFQEESSIPSKSCSNVTESHNANCIGAFAATASIYSQLSPDPLEAAEVQPIAGALNHAKVDRIASYESNSLTLGEEFPVPAMKSDAPPAVSPQPGNDSGDMRDGTASLS